MPLVIDSLPIEIQTHDIALLRGLFESRVMTLAHATALYFDGKYERAKKRVQKLKRAGLVRERTRRIYEPSVLFLTKPAYTLLCQGDHLSEYARLTWERLEGRIQVSELTIQHELEIMDVKAEFLAAISRRSAFDVKEFTTWPQLISFNTFHPATGAKITVKPDGFMRLQEIESDGSESEHMFFLEVDRSTESLKILIRRILCYLNYYKSGGLAARLGGLREAYKDFPFRVLVVCKSPERRNNIAAQLLTTNPPLRTFAWLTTLAELVHDPLGEIWLTPAALAEGQMRNEAGLKKASI